MQVVAGTNYALSFDTYYDCTTPTNTPSFGAVTLNAIIFEPLPRQGTNQQFQVRASMLPGSGLAAFHADCGQQHSDVLLWDQVRKVWNITEA